MALPDLPKVEIYQRRLQTHCKFCGSDVVHRVPDDGDTKVRAICSNLDCLSVHYENPLNVVGTVPYWIDSETKQVRVLLCKRNIEPRFGKWTLPAGFMEINETTSEGAIRETNEEAGAQIELEGLFSILNVVYAGQVHFFYRAKLLNLTFNPGFETQETQLLTEDEIPWDEIAFRTVKKTLKRFFEDYKKGSFDIHHIDLEWIAQT